MQDYFELFILLLSAVVYFIIRTKNNTVTTTDYIEYIFIINPLQPAADILIAQLSEIDFECFVEIEQGIEAYIQKQLWNKKAVTEIPILHSKEFKISYQHKEIPRENWNEQWEQNFHPIIIDEQCMIRASFHPKNEATTYDIVINPKMSFGTGHHETTHMMVQHLLSTDCQGKKVMDMGCGTGVLGILTSMRGADAIDGVDVDPWCIENAKENVQINHIDGMKLYLGDASFLDQQQYDIFIANINRNILLQDIPQYSKTINSGGVLLLSGYYESDFEQICKTAQDHGFIHNHNIIRNQWTASKFTKK